MVHGDKRKFLSALITLNREEIERVAKEQQWKLNANLSHHPEVLKLVGNIVDEKNHKLASYETIKKFQIIDNDFSIETCELTPSLKVKRKYCNQKYKDIIDRFYE